MADIINFGVERAKRKSGIKDTALLKDMVKEGYDPNPLIYKLIMIGLTEHYV